LTNKRKMLADRITAALNVAFEYTTDGAHHKQWVIDQMIRELLGNQLNYDKWIANYEEDGEYEWDIGTAP
jgi:hypothetical protein